MTDRHILITGGAGYIGSLLTSELLRLNYRVTVLDSLLFGGESLVPFLHHPNFHFVKSDVTEPRAIKDAVKVNWQKPNSIIHLAAIVGFPACQAVGKQVAWKYNVDATNMVFGQASDLVWGYAFDGNGNVLEVYVGYLRHKTEAGGEVRLIHTVRGVGYALREEA